MAKLYKVRKKCMICGNIFYPRYAGSLYCEDCKNKKKEEPVKPVKKAMAKAKPAKKPARHMKVAKRPAKKQVKKTVKKTSRKR